MFEKVSTKAATGGAAKQALGLDATTVVAKLEQQLADRQQAVHDADKAFSAALKAEARGEAGSSVSAARKALQHVAEAMQDCQRALADARQDAIAEQAAKAEQALADAWSNCDQIQAAIHAEAVKVDQAAVTLAEAFRALLTLQIKLVQTLPDSSHDFRIRLQGVAAFEAVSARLRELCPELVGKPSMGGLKIPTVAEAVGELYAAIRLHYGPKS